MADEQNIVDNFGDLIDKIVVQYNKGVILDFVTSHSFKIIEESMDNLQEKFETILSVFEEIQKDLISLDEKYRIELPILTEDLGIITPEVARLRDDFNFPTMKILQFAFDLNEFKSENMINPYLPHNHKKNCAVYTGSHDNDTIMGCLESSSDEMLKFIYTYLYGKKEDERICSILNTYEFKKELASEIIRKAFSSVADFAAVQMQDLLFLNSEARMNEPSTVGRNWQWRVTGSYENCEMTEKLQLWNILYNRV